MKLWLNILPVVAAVAVLAVGGGGLSLMCCSCSGKVSLASGSDCCPSESGCMTFSTLRLSDSAPTDQCVPPVPTEFAIVQSFSHSSFQTITLPSNQTFLHSPFEAFAPPGVETSMVMRV